MSGVAADDDVVVERVGSQALVVDRGRPGWAHIGVTGAGALDAPAHRLAQRLVGNDEDAAGLEILLGGLALRCGRATTVALAGPPCGLDVRRDGRVVRRPGSHRAVHVRAGDVVVVASPETGLRGYLALDGGVAVAPVLGSRSTDTLSGLGPAPLTEGTRLPLGPARTRSDRPPAAFVPVPASVVGGHVDLPLHLGPRDGWLHDAAAELRAARWTVAPAGDRIGVRLDGVDGARLERAAAHRDEELPSEGLVTGAVQVPGDGRPVVFLADHPTTGGYPVVGVVDPAALPALAQARPGSSVRLRPLSASG